MGKKLEEHKKNNIDKIRTGSCIELFLLLNNFYSDFDKVTDFLEENEFLLRNQNKSTIIQQMNDIKGVLVNNIDIVLDDIDTNGSYMEYILKAY